MHPIEPSQRAAAKVAGVLYVVIMAASIFAESYARDPIVIPRDAAQTAKNIQASESLFRAGTVIHLLNFAGDVALLVAFYVILKPVNASLALLAAFWRVVESAILSVVLLNDFVALRLLGNAEYLKTFDASQLQALARVFLSVHGIGFSLGFVFLGLGSTLFAYLWFKSRYVPRAIAAWGIFASLMLALGSLAVLLSPRFGAVAGITYMIPMFFYEVGLGLWLIVKGLRVE